MLDIRRLVGDLPSRQLPEAHLGESPSKEEIRDAVLRFKREGTCGRRIAQQHLGPYFIASDIHGQREIELLEEVIAEEYEGTNLCILDRGPECSRFRGGCKRYRRRP